jgi:transcriptional regulator with PAS, ATPase and Fis domain
MLDIRLICATNCQLEAEVAQGRFRTDLFHRINVVRIHIPPLRERPSDIPLLVDKFVRVYSAQFGRIRKPISPTFLRLLQWYEWPGNVRELENVVKRYVLLGDDEHIVPGTPALIGLSAASPPADTAPLHSKGAIQGFEKKVLLEVLRSHNWNRAKAARSLGINYRVLLHKMKEAGLPGVRSPIVATRKLSGGDSGGMPV